MKYKENNKDIWLIMIDAINDNKNMIKNTKSMTLNLEFLKFNVIKIKNRKSSIKENPGNPLNINESSKQEISRDNSINLIEFIIYQ